MLPFLGIQLIYVAIAVLKIESIHKSADNVKDLSGCYDYIVIGLGSAGSVVANRLAEDSSNKVLGLEAGIAQSAITDIPPMYPLFTASVYDWNFFSVPQKRMGLAFTGQRLALRSGKAIGGSSVINYMLYNRGNRKVYDKWSETYGAIGWDYNNVLKYFIKYENNTDLKIVEENPGYHGIDGPVGISSPLDIDPILLDLIKAMSSLGFQTIDINGAQQLGITINQLFIKNGLRSSTANAYLEPNPYPTNLFISLNSYVTKILIENSTAIGVEFFKNNNKYKVYASKEIIVSAGSLLSPKILMLSGIGLKYHLNQLGITVIADLPVGNNLLYHYNLSDLYAMIKDSSKVITSSPPALTVPNLYQLYAYKSGILSQFASTTAFYSTKYNDNSWPNTAFHALGQKLGNDFTPLVTRFNPIIQNQWKTYYSQLANQTVIILVPYLVSTKSVGTVRLNSSNPFDPPIIDPNSLSDIRDLKNYIEILRFMFYVLEKSSLSSQVTIPKLSIPGCSYCANKPRYECDQYLECVIKQLGGISHMSGTCRMGSVNRNDIVVDERLKVKGIKNLRVCDNSIIPLMPNSNANAVAIMIGEYGSHIIRDDNS